MLKISALLFSGIVLFFAFFVFAESSKKSFPSIFFLDIATPDPFPPQRFDRVRVVREIKEKQDTIKHLEYLLYTLNSDLASFHLGPYIPSEAWYSAGDSDVKIKLLQAEIVQARAALSAAQQFRGMVPKPWEPSLRRLSFPRPAVRVMSIMPRRTPLFLKK